MHEALFKWFNKILSKKKNDLTIKYYIYQIKIYYNIL